MSEDVIYTIDGVVYSWNDAINEFSILLYEGDEVPTCEDCKHPTDLCGWDDEYFQIDGMILCYECFMKYLEKEYANKWDEWDDYYAKEDIEWRARRDGFDFDLFN